MGRLRWALPGVVTSAIAGAIGNYLFDVSFWLIAILTLLSFIANGIFSDWEDRGKFND